MNIIEFKVTRTTPVLHRELPSHNVKVYDYATEDDARRTAEYFGEMYSEIGFIVTITCRTAEGWKFYKEYKPKNR